MSIVAITQRVHVTEHKERRDCLDQRWHSFLKECGLTALALPNDVQAATVLLNTVRPAGLILSGGNDLSRFSGDAPEREAMEFAMLELFLGQGKPVLGICRGMQFLADYYACGLKRVEGHVGTRHQVRFADGAAREVNSYHHYGVSSVNGGMQVGAIAEDDSIEMIHHKSSNVTGMMWHPEREDPVHADDVQLFRRIFMP